MGDRPGHRETPDDAGRREGPTRALRRPGGEGAYNPSAGRGDEAYSAGQPAYRVPPPAGGGGRGRGDDAAGGATTRHAPPGEASQLGAEDGSGRGGRSRVYGKPRPGSSPVRPLGGPEKERRPREPKRRDPRRTGRIALRALAVLVVLLVVLGLGGFFWIDSRLQAVDSLTDYEGRPAATPGQDWLLVGSDSRAGLTAAQRRKLATGRAPGKRTDTMMLLHVPDGDGKPTLVSLPRDSYVPIPGHGSDRLNAAYSFGGPKLLARTVEKVTGIRLDHYMEIGFGGFVGIVDAVGGVNICVKAPIKDPKAGINLKKGCQDMDGGTALGYVRTRATGSLPDFDRTQRQRQFFSAVVKKAAAPGVLANPFRSIPLAMSATDSVAVDPDTGAFDMLGLGLAMGGDPVTTAVPVGSLPTINGASVVKWDTQRALRLFNALAEDKPVPKDVLSR
ncbi:LCP family protein [Sphaerisporangium sp. TRM90804]|uniref:LCP family protein n=1 Tax=Sphaerisporangium sp. TRM90804 TaxID=3031113 RepID=UPI0024495AF3|nr:LCP family protein [Sphaerisporangium sp. TRM90804]MDH2425688.1 LCP family protein [Sphaerisporangium sp. TRM90804]